MKKLAFVIAGAAALTVSACNNKNDDAVSNAELNQPAAEDLNATANDAATNAEDQALGNQQRIEDQNASAPVATNTSDPVESDEQNVSGM
jgi:cell division septation protein DedD